MSKSELIYYSTSCSLLRLNRGLLTCKCVSSIAKQLVPCGRASIGTALPAMLCAASASVKTGVSSLIFPLSLAAKTELISLIKACCCSILSPFHRLELRKNTLNSFVQILNSTGVALLVSVSGYFYFDFVCLLCLFYSDWCSFFRCGE